MKNDNYLATLTKTRLPCINFPTLSETIKKSTHLSNSTPHYEPGLKTARPKSQFLGLSCCAIANDVHVKPVYFRIWCFQKAIEKMELKIMLFNVHLDQKLGGIPSKIWYFSKLTSNSKINQTGKNRKSEFRQIFFVILFIENKLFNSKKAQNFRTLAFQRHEMSKL